MPFRIYCLVISSILFVSFFASFSSGAHYAIGRAIDARDGTSANGMRVTVWNPANGISNNVTDIVGTSGLSETSNFFMVDCEELSVPCQAGHNLSAAIFNNGSNYITQIVNLTVAPVGGFDLFPNMTLNSPPSLISLIVDDSTTSPGREIDLTPLSTKTVTCQAVVSDSDGESDIGNFSAKFFDSVSSSLNAADDNNQHYTNTSCFVNATYGNSNQSLATCSFNTWYYARSSTWNCTVYGVDTLNTTGQRTNDTIVNSLLAISVADTLDFGQIAASVVSSEQVMNVTNAGNVYINLTLRGYAVTVGDGNAMNCSLGSTKNISVYYEKFNLTASNPGGLTLSNFEARYTNLTATSSVKRFNMAYRENDVTNEAINATYWRIYVPAGVAGSCRGNIQFGAYRGAET